MTNLDSEHVGHAVMPVEKRSLFLGKQAIVDADDAIRNWVNIEIYSAKTVY